MSFYPKPFSYDDAREWIERNMKSYDANGFGLWAMDLKSTGEFIGQCGLTIQQVEGESHVEVGWHVNRAYWRQGFASEAGAACLDVASRRFGLDRVISLILKENVPSAGVARKLGMDDRTRGRLQGPAPRPVGHRAH